MIRMRGEGVWGGASQRKSEAPLARGCFLLLLMLMMMMMNGVQGFNIRQQSFTMGINSGKLRGVRSALMHPTAIVFSPSKENPKQQHPVKHLGSSSSTLMTPGAASHDNPRGQIQPYGQNDPDLATPAITPPPQWPGPSGNNGPIPKWSNTKPTNMYGNRRGWAARTVDWGAGNSHGGGWATPQRPSYTWQDTKTTERQDTYGRELAEDLSHLQNRPSGRQQKITEDENPTRGRTVFKGGSGHTPLWAMENKDTEEDRGSDFNASEYQPDDYYANHDYDNRNIWRLDQTPNTETLTLKNVMEMHDLTSQTDLHSLLGQRGITLQELKDFLNDGASKKDVLEFLQASTTSTTILTTTTSPPVLSYPPGANDTSVVEEGYQDDRVPLPVPTVTPGTDNEETDDSKEQRKNRRKERKRKGGRRKKTRKNKKQKEEDSTTQSPTEIQGNAMQIPPHPWLPNTLPETIATTMVATRDILLPTTTPQSTPNISTTPPLVKTSDASILLVTVVEASDTELETPRLTFIEGDIHPRKHNPSRSNPWEERGKKIHHIKPSQGIEETINEEEVSFVREKHKDDYVFPLRGLLIVSGLMGALVVFTLVVLVSYAVVKCTKKPVVNNYQVSQQQTPAGT